MQPHTALQLLLRQVTALPQLLTLAVRQPRHTLHITTHRAALRLRSTQVKARQQHSRRPARPQRRIQLTIILRIARPRRFPPHAQQLRRIKRATQQVTRPQQRFLHRAVRQQLTRLAAVRPQRFKRAIRHRTQQRRHLTQLVQLLLLLTQHGLRLRLMPLVAVRQLHSQLPLVRHRHLQRLLLLLEAP